MLCCAGALLRIDILECKLELLIVIYSPVDGPFGLEKDYRLVVSVENEKRCGSERHVLCIEPFDIGFCPAREAVGKGCSYDVYVLFGLKSVFKNVELEYTDNAHYVCLCTDVRLLVELDCAFL